MQYCTMIDKIDRYLGRFGKRSCDSLGFPPIPPQGSGWNHTAFRGWMGKDHVRGAERTRSSASICCCSTLSMAVSILLISPVDDKAGNGTPGCDHRADDMLYEGYARSNFTPIAGRCAKPHDLVIKHVRGLEFQGMIQGFGVSRVESRLPSPLSGKCWCGMVFADS